MEYIQRFHHLQGSSHSEVHQMVNKYLKDISKLPREALADHIQQIVPQNHAEELIHLKLLLQHGSFEDLQVILFKGNKILNKKLTSNLQFINQLAQISPEHFVSRICPEISFITRTQIINKLPLVIIDEIRGQAFFEAIKTNYGVRAAWPLMPTCSQQFIRESLLDHQMSLNDKQLIKLHAKFPDFLQFYFEQHGGFAKRKRLARHLALYDVPALRALIKHGLPHLGRKASIKFLTAHKKDVLDEPETYWALITPRIANSCFQREEYVEFLAKMLPEMLDHFYFSYDLQHYLKAAPWRTRGGDFFRAFEVAYKMPYGEEYLNEALLELLTNEERCKFDLGDEFTVYKPSDVSVPLIMEKIGLTGDVNARSELVENLLWTCKYNRDPSALLDVLRYFSTRHKNDLMQIYRQFVSTLSIHGNFPLQLLSQNHWNYINDVLTLCEINGENMWAISDMIEARIHFKHLNGLNYIDDIFKLIKNRGFYNWYLVEGVPEVTKVCLLQIAAYIETNYDNVDEKAKAVDAFFSAVLKFNRKYKADAISLLKYASLIDVYFACLKRDNRDRSTQCLKELLTAIPRDEKEVAVKEKMTHGYFNACPHEDENQINNWLLSHAPDIVLDHAQTYFTREKFDLKPKFYYEATKIVPITKKFKELALNTVNGNSSDSEEMTIALRYLSFQDPTLFLQIVKRYRPKNDCRIDIYEKNVREIIAVHKSVLNSLKNVHVGGECISEVLVYCKEDYLVHSLKTLYTSMYNLPEKLIHAPIEVLMGGKISVQEHAIYLAANLGNSNHIRSIFATTKGNISLAKFVFKRTFKALTDYPLDDYFELLLEHFESLDKNDDESFEMILQVRKIPRKYQSAYIRFMWVHPKLQKLRFGMLNSINLKLWNELSRDLCTQIISDSLFNSQYTHTMKKFIYEYLINNGDLRVIVNIKHQFDDRALFELLQYLVDSIIEDTKRRTSGLELCRKLLDNLPQIPLYGTKHPLEMQLKSCKHMLEIDGDIIAPLADFMVHLQEEQVFKYGPQIAAYFRNFAKRFVRIAIETVNTKTRMKETETDLILEAAERIANNNSSTIAKLLALQLVPRKKTKDENFNKSRKRVVDEILKDCDEIVKIYVDDVYYTENI